MAKKRFQDDNQNTSEEGGTNMQENMQNEFEGTEADVTTPVEGAEGTEATATATGTEAEARKWHNDEGQEVSMSQFIKLRFNEGMSRSDIADKFEINYRTVYGATMNMDNGTVSARGRAQTISEVTTILVEGVAQVLTIRDGKVFLDNAASALTVEEVEAMEKVVVKRDDFIKEQVAAGVAKKAIASKLDVSYGVIHNATKVEGATTTRHMVTVTDAETGETKEVPRAEHIRALFAGGMKKAEIAKHLGVDYTIVWQACSQASTDAEKFEKNLEALAKMADSVDGEEAKATFLKLIEELKLTPIKVETEGDETETEAPVEETEAAPAE